MNESVHQRACVARLVTACESIIQRGLLDADEEHALRVLTNATCEAFKMTKVEEDINRAA